LIRDPVSLLLLGAFFDVALLDFGVLAGALALNRLSRPNTKP
jgi:hypothetical protein